MSRSINQSPEETARDRIDERLQAAGWHVQNNEAIDFNVGAGIAVREYQTDIGPADYVLFVERQPVGVVEAKRDSWGERLTTAEEQSEGYANAKLKWASNSAPLPFLYESTGNISRFTNGCDPNPRSREVFNFPRPEALQDWARTPMSLRTGIASLPPLKHDGLRGCQIKAITQLEASLKANKPRALVQMATGSGKTFTAITRAEVVRLLDLELDAADTLEAEIDAALARAEALRQSILKDAFAGRLVPQDPQDEPASDLLARIGASCNLGSTTTPQGPAQQRIIATHPP